MTTSPYQDKPSPWSSHSRILSYLQALPEKSKVFDVGTASGMLARRGNSSLRYFGVESNVEWATIASPFYERLWTCAFDEMQLEDLQGYDVIVLGDVLEHMANPEIALKRLVELQPRGSLFIISVPNVANLWVRLHLLTGNFDYAERGILDRTHLRFFTRKSLIDLIKKCDLQIDSIAVTPIPLELISTFFNTSLGTLIHAIFAYITSFFPTLLAYQFIVKAKRL
jgi:SAM-dependent methyltransferase